MEAVTNNFCSGCLSIDRKMKLVHEHCSRQTFFKILVEILIPTSELHAFSLWLCWECEVRISNFLAFREQLKSSYKILQEYAKENNKIQPQSVSKLLICSQGSIDIDINSVNEPQIKEEQDNKDDPELKIKNETEYSDDNRSLFDIRNEKVMSSPKKYSKYKIKEKKAVKGSKKRKQNVFYEMIVLNHEEVLKERILMEVNEEFVNSMFKCDKCIITFANKEDLDEHVLTKHVLHASKYTCRVCERAFGAEHSLTVHSRSHNLRWRCVLCAHRSNTERAAQAHYRDRHKERGCPEMFELAAKAYQSYGDKLEDALEDNRPKSEEQYPCEYCNKTFRWKTSLRKHMETHSIEAGHKRKPYCETCRLSFTTTSNLRKHVKTSSKHQIQLNLRKLKEDIAVTTSDPAQQAKDLESIKSKINGQKERFQCPQCEKKFQWKGNLLRHLKSHAARANGDLVCEPCNRTFSSIATYKQHMKISRKHVSENEFKYMCSDCGKRFSNKIKLRDHIDWEHLKNYTHTCTECKKVFKSHTSLYLHRQVVHRQYNAEHLCDHCGKSFPNKTKLRGHIIALHTRESPYKCDTCSARFSWHSCLSRHVRRVHRNVLRHEARVLV